MNLHYWQRAWRVAIAPHFSIGELRKIKTAIIMDRLGIFPSDFIPNDEDYDLYCRFHEWFTETPRSVVRHKLLAEVEAEIKKRG